jgi:hypothetical protein
LRPRGLHQAREGRLAAERLVDRVEVGGVVFVVGGRAEDGRQVDRVDAQRGDVAEARGDAVQIAARMGRSVLALLVDSSEHSSRRRETVDEDLIDHLGHFRLLHVRAIFW